jgi:hypothetical protein
LRLLIVIEFAFDSAGGGVEKIDCRPKKVLEIDLKARVADRGDQRVEDYWGSTQCGRPNAGSIVWGE